MSINIIVAMTESRVIGKDGKIPWYIPEDFRHFKRTTIRNTVIMGRNTYESMGKPLKKRNNIVLTKKLNNIGGVYVCSTLEEALEMSKEFGKDVFIIGGSSVYKEALPLRERMFISYVKKDYMGDVYFPKVNFKKWEIEKDFEIGSPLL